MIWDKPLDDLLPTWVLSELNKMQQDTMLLCPNAVVNIPNEMARKRKLFNFSTLKRLAWPLNVGKRCDEKMFIGGVNDSGNHWVLVIVEMRPFKQIVYCDTLAWDPPSNIVDVVNNFTSNIHALRPSIYLCYRSILQR